MNLQQRHVTVVLNLELVDKQIGAVAGYPPNVVVS